MNDWDRAEQLVAGARAGYEPSRADRERVRRQLGARLAAAGLVSSAAANVAGAAAANGGAWLGGNTLLGLGKLAVGTMLVTVATGTAFVAASRALSPGATTKTVASKTTLGATTGRAGAESTPDGARYGAAPPAQSSSDVVSVVGAPRLAPTGEAPFAEDAAARTAEPPHSRPAARILPSARSAARAEVVSSDAGPPPANLPADAGALDAELALLQEAKRNMTSADYASALATLARLDREHRAGALLEEREALRVVIACKTGDAAQSERIAAFRARYASSVYRSRIDGVCGRAATSGSNGTPSVIDPSESGH